MEFLTWFTANGGNFHPSAELATGGDGERLVRVRPGCSIGPDMAIVTCPHVMTLSALKGSPLLSAEGDDLDLRPYKMSMSVTFRIQLMWQYLLGQKSFWGGYIRSLPQPGQPHSLNTAVFFDEDDSAWLRGTNVGSAVKIRIEAWREEFAEVDKMLEQVKVQGRKLWTFDLYIWAASIISSRCFPASAFSNDTLGLPVLIPGLDLLDHSPAAKVTWGWGASGCTLSTDVELHGGAQIFNNYGPKSNEELLMGYGFCLENNIADCFNLSCSPAFENHESLVKARDLLFRKADAVDQSLGADDESSRNGDQDANGSVNGTNGHETIHSIYFRPQGTQRTSIETQYGFSPGFLADFSLLFCNQRETQPLGSHFVKPKSDANSFSGTTLGRNKLHVLSALIMILQNKRANIRKHDKDLPQDPRGSRQRYASIYRASQLRILEGVLQALENTFVSLISLPQVVSDPEKRDVDVESGTPYETRIVGLPDVLGSVSAGSNDSQSVLPGRLRQSIRPIIHAGLGTRDPTKIARYGGDEFTFAIWIYGLWILNSAKGDDAEDDHSEGSALSPSLQRWLRNLDIWYSIPTVSTEGQQAELVVGGKVDPDMAAHELHETAVSYLQPIQGAVSKHPDSVFRTKRNLTNQKSGSMGQANHAVVERLMWCLSVVRGEGVRCPHLIFASNSGKEVNDRGRAAGSPSGDFETDDDSPDSLVLVIEVG